MQRGEDPEARLFQKIAEQGHYAGRVEPSDTRQGLYAATASGVLLGSLNHRQPARVARMLREALAKYEALPAAERRRSDAERSAPAPRRWEDRYPPDGLALAQYSRDVGRAAAEGRDWRARAWNKDFAWFDAAEAASLVPLDLEVGARRDWPAALIRRLARLHLLDNVRGQTSALPEDAVLRARATSEVVAVEGERVELRITGRTRTLAEGEWAVHGFADRGAPGEHVRGFDAELLGRATWDRAARRFVAFELLAVGTRVGATQFNGRHDDPGPAPLGILFELAGATPADRVPPAFVWEYGW